MKLRLVPKNADERRRELKRKLALQQRRFDEAAMRAARVIQRDFSISRWIRDYPLETALFVMASGIILAQTVERLQREPVRPIPG